MCKLTPNCNRSLVKVTETTGRLENRKRGKRIETYLGSFTANHEERAVSESGELKFESITYCPGCCRVAQAKTIH